MGIFDADSNDYTRPVTFKLDVALREKKKIIRPGKITLALSSPALFRRLQRFVACQEYLKSERNAGEPAESRFSGSFIWRSYIG